MTIGGTVQQGRGPSHLAAAPSPITPSPITPPGEFESMNVVNRTFLREHAALTRRYFLRCGAAGLAAIGGRSLLADESGSDDEQPGEIDIPEPWLTAQDDFQDVSRGNPKPHTLDDQQLGAAGLTRQTWKLEVVSDPEYPAVLHRPLSAAQGTAFDFAQLLQLAETKAVRFAKVMTCLNIGCPLGNGIWEGVPLRDVLWMTEPEKDLRRVVYHGYHNDDPKQLFRSSLPVGRVLEDPFGLPPVILCYKLNGEFLSPQRGGPVRMVVPEAYGFKSIKWLTHVYLSNIAAANDTYGEQNNDVDSPLKTFCATLSIPGKVPADKPIAVSGYAQVGISGLRKVQVWFQLADQAWPVEDQYFQTAPWVDAQILPPPRAPRHGPLDEPPVRRGVWGAGLDAIPLPAIGFDPDSGLPQSWPMRLSKVHWATLHPGLPPGKYNFRCRTIDEQGSGQPLPRPFQKSGHAAIEAVNVEVTA
jgi:DMSO/TMAO reductase YedYZ molybdopterin-dependent catalytic subunit